MNENYYLVKKTVKTFYFLGVLYLLFVFNKNYLAQLNLQAKATSRTLTTKVDFKNGQFTNTEADSKEGEIKLTDAGAYGPRLLRSPNLQLGNGAAISYNNDYIYTLFPGDNYFARYVVSENRWQALTRGPHYAFTGSDLVVLGNYVYAIFGGYQREFARYSIVNKTWEELPVLLDLVYSGASLVTDGTNIYATKGNNTQTFWVYEPGAGGDYENGSWSQIRDLPAGVGAGADLVYHNGYIYTPRGNSTSNNQFYRYTVSANSWTTMAVLPSGSIPTVAHSIGIDTTNGAIYLAATGRTPTTLLKYLIDSNTGNPGSWSIIGTTPQITSGVGLVFAPSGTNGSLYIFRGNTTYDFWKYDLDNNAFAGLLDLPAAASYGSDLLYYNLSGTNYAYYSQGGAQTTYRRYNLDNSTWATMATAPSPGLGASNVETKGIVAGSALYYYSGTANYFWRYVPITDTWKAMSTAPGTVTNGGSLIYVGTSSSIIATQGGNRTVWQWTIGDPGTWSVLSGTLPDDAEVYLGSKLITDGTDPYYIAGAGVSKMYKYNGSAWVFYDNLPFAPYYGTDVTHYNGKFYFLAGYYKTDIWEYSVTTKIWRRLKDIPSVTSGNGINLGPYYGASIESGTAGNLYITYGQGLTNWLTYNVSGSSYSATGSWTSEILDLTYVSAWGSLDVGKTENNGTITVQTRTSSDAENWNNGGWTDVTGTTINSTTARYIQLKVNFTAAAGQSSTPILKDITINYTGDAVAPSNPSSGSFTGKSQSSGGTTLTSGTGTSYKYPAPYFTWSAGTDNQSGVDGYYVYFGTSPDADPQILGNYQTGTNYTVTTPMEEKTYYLLIKTKDVSGNVSASAVTGFIYQFNGALNQAVSITSASQIGSGTFSNFSLSGSSLRLSGTAGVWQDKRLGMLPAAAGYGAAIAYMEGNGTDNEKRLFALNGNNTRTFYEYILSGTTWTAKSTMPIGSPNLNVYNGGAMVEGPNRTLYAFKGQGNPYFYKYDVPTNTWSEIVQDDNPSVNYGAAMVYDGTQYIYVMKGNSSFVFKRFDPNGETWTDLANTDFGATDRQPANTVYNGGDLAYNPAGKIYAIQGNSYTGFSEYDISGDSWTVLTNVPAAPNAGAQIEYDSTTNAVYYFPGNNKPFFYKYSVSDQSWSQLADSPFNLTAGTAMKIVDGIIYVLRGGTQYFYQYNIAKASWQFPVTDFWGNRFRGAEFNSFYYGANIVKGDSNYYYLTRGYYDSTFVRYNPVSGDVARMSDMPAGMYQGGELVYDSTHNKIFALASSNLRAFYQYDIESDTWTELTGSQPPADPADGSTMVYDGTQYIYWARGGGTTTLYKYNTITSGTWVSSGTTPAAFGAGGDLVLRDNYLYGLRGNNQSNIYRYGPLSGSPAWTSMGTTPATVTTDGFMVDGGYDSVLAKNSLYICRGNNTNTCWQFVIEGTTWTTVQNTPVNIYQGGAGDSDGSRMVVIGAYNTTNTYNNAIYTYNLPNTNSTSFVESGSYVSSVVDLTSVYQYASLQINYTTAPSNNLSVYTRTSSDNTTWSSWSAVSQTKTTGTSIAYKINSTVNRYLQVRFDLTSGDGLYSGVINGWTINYYQDTSAPTNPSSLTAYAAVGSGTTLTSGTWYNYASPSFDWPDAESTGGATDGTSASGIAGYLIYFGTTATISPLNASSDAASGTYFTTASSYTAPSLTSGKTYYLRILAEDNAYLTSGTVWDAYTYKYDGSGPTGISSSYVTVNPDGYSAVKDDYSFSWDATTDDGSGVAGYCYKTGASGSTDTCITSTSVASISAYQTGINTFFLRVKDYASNYSSYADVNYKYSGSAVAAPENLIVSSTVSSTYTDFSFSWDMPASSSYSVPSSNIQFFYSMNEAPSASTVENWEIPLTYSERSIDYTDDSEMFKSLLSGTNVFYVVAWDGTYTDNDNKTKDTRNIDWDNYTSVSFTYDSSAPNPPEDLDIADISIKAEEQWKIAVTWSAPSVTSSTVLSYKVYRSTSTSCGSDSQEVGYITGTSFADDVTSLGQATYYYCVKTCQETRSNCSSASDTVSLYPDGKWTSAPTLTASPSATVKTKTATITWSTSRASNSFIKYGKTSSLGQEVGSSNQVTAHSITLTGLDPGTTYYYQVIWTDEDGNSSSTSTQTLATNAAPYVSDVKKTNVSLYTASITFTVKNANKATVQYGKTLSYGGSESLTVATTESTYTISLKNLTEGSLYNFRIAAEDEEANIYYSDNYTLQTLPVPKLTNLKIQQVVGMPTATLRLIWTSNTPITTLITYYPVSNPELAKDYVNAAPVKAHEAIIKDLKDETEYTIIISGKDAAGNEAKADTQKIKTAVDFRPPEIINLNIETTITGVGEEARAKVVVSWDTDEPATTQIEYGQGAGGVYTNTTQEDKAVVSNHMVTIPNLMPSSIYHLRIISKDKAGNAVQSEDSVVITPKSTQGALDLVVDNLSKTFGFLKDIKQ